MARGRGRGRGGGSGGSGGSGRGSGRGGSTRGKVRRHGGHGGSRRAPHHHHRDGGEHGGEGGQDRPSKLELVLDDSTDEEEDYDDGEYDEYDDDSDDAGENNGRRNASSNSSGQKTKMKRSISGKALFYEKNKHRFDMNYRVLQWNLTELQTPRQLQPVSDYYQSVKQYCFSFLDYVFEETRAEIIQSVQTNSHGDIAKCKIVKWKKGKNKGDAASVSFEIIPRENRDQSSSTSASATQTQGFIPLFQKHDYVVVSRSPRLDELEQHNHFFAIIEEGNQLSVSKFNQQSQPWLRRGGGGRRMRGGGGGGGGGRRRMRGGRKGGRMKGGRHGAPSTADKLRQHMQQQQMSNLSTNFKAKFYVHPHTKHMINLESSKGRSKSGKRIYLNDKSYDYWFVIPVYNMVTKHREYESIQRMAVPEFLSETWTKKRSQPKHQRGKAPAKVQRADNIAPKLKEYLQQNHNPAQFRAIDEVLNDTSKKVHLIHGPPGTGKTSTLLGLINALLANKQRVLICSGTNVAVDHIVAKISKHGLRNNNGERYDPSRNRMARIGNDEKIDELSKEIDPATRFKRLVKMIKDIRNKMDAIRREQFEVLEKSRQSKSVVNARNSIIGRSDKIINLLNMAEATIPQLLTTKFVNNELVEPMYKKFESVREVILEFLAMGKKLELKKLDLMTAAESAYNQIQVLCDECQRYLSIDNRDVEKKILDNCDIVFATLAITGRQMMRDCKKFNVLIIDEAAQVTESESMIPLDLITDQVVLIGDPHQLPSTVLSQEAIDKKYNRSMFERMINIIEQEEKAGLVPVHKPTLLDTQYRMHPSISQYPEHQFYNNTLKDGENVKQYHMYPEWKPRYDNGLHPCLFINCPDSREVFNPMTKSYQNEQEADLVVKLIDLYMTKYGIKRSQIAVITFYRGQVDLIRSKLTKYDEMRNKMLNPVTPTTPSTLSELEYSESEQESDHGNNTESEYGGDEDDDDDDDDSDDEDFVYDEDEEWYDVNTVDSYQGSEKQVCILSTVRANDRGNLGFCIDRRRLNVAITRAQFSLTIVGHGESLCVNDLWKSFVRNVQIVEPDQVPDLLQPQQQQQQQQQQVDAVNKDDDGNGERVDEHILVRSIKRKHLKFVSAILKNRLLKSSSELDARQLWESCVNTNNHTLLSHFIKLNKISVDSLMKHRQVAAAADEENVLQYCLNRKSYSCATTILSRSSATHPLVLEKNKSGLLPIQQCIFDYGKCKREHKEEIVKLFDKLSSIMAIVPSVSIEQQSLTNVNMFDSIKDKHGESITTFLTKKNYPDLLEVVKKYSSSTSDTHSSDGNDETNTSKVESSVPSSSPTSPPPPAATTTTRAEQPRVAPISTPVVKSTTTAAQSSSAPPSTTTTTTTVPNSQRAARAQKPKHQRYEKQHDRPTNNSRKNNNVSTPAASTPVNNSAASAPPLSQTTVAPTTTKPVQQQQQERHSRHHTKPRPKVQYKKVFEPVVQQQPSNQNTPPQ